MIKFIDSDGIIFDGNQPYTFWFDEGQSVNIKYSKNILIISDAANININIPDNQIFKLINTYNLQNNNQININNFNFYDINANNILVNQLSLSGYNYLNFYIYNFNILASSQDAGQYTETFYINDDKFTIGADFYTENEILRSNLENIGIEIPQTIQRAIYESNIHEELTDNILMNRKWKELLLEYWSIFAVKGNCKSSINSLKWFEYGDLLTLNEYWKRNDNIKTLYNVIENDSYISDNIRKQLGVLVKTTLLGIYCSKEKILRDTNNNVVYDTENNPMLYNIIFKHTLEDMLIKITLLGNFYATYFTPLHISIIHSTLEDIVFTNTQKLLVGSHMNRKDFIDTFGTFKCDILDKYYIKNCKAFVYTNTIFGQLEYHNIYNNSNIETRIYNDNILGVDTNIHILEDFNNSNNMINDILNVVSHYTIDIGAIVDFNVYIEKNVLSTDFIKKGYISWKKDNITSYNYNNYYIINPILKDDKYIFEFMFQLLFKTSGIYNIFITFETNRGIKYTKEFNITICENIRNKIDLYKLKRIDPYLFQNIDISLINNENININMDNLDDNLLYLLEHNGLILENNINFNNVSEFMFNNVLNNNTIKNQTQIINYSRDNNLYEIGVNHTILLPIYEDVIYNLSTQYGQNDNIPTSVSLTYEDYINIYNLNPGALMSLLNNNFPHYWWFIKKNTNMLYADIDYEIINQYNSTNKTDIIVGIRKYFSIETYNNIIFRKNYKFYNDNFEIIIFSGLLKNFIMIKKNGITYKCEFIDKKNKYDIEILLKNNNIHTVHVDIQDNIISKNFKNATPEYKININIGYINSINNYKRVRYINEERFFPCFHYIEPLMTGELNKNELCVVIPNFGISKNIDIDSWEFNNISNNKKYTFNHSKQPFIASTHNTLSPGVYNIILNYKMDNNIYKYSREFAFIQK